jgi:hypothetical protein
MITLEYLAEQKAKYQSKVDYFSKIDYDHLTADFKGVIDLIGEMEDYMKENEDGKD